MANYNEDTIQKITNANPELGDKIMDTLGYNTVQVPSRVADINAEIARQGNKGYSVAPSVISSDLLSNNQKPVALPEANQDTIKTAGSSVQGLTEGLNQSSLATIQQEQDLKAQQAKAQADSSTSKVQGLIDKLMGKGQAQVSAEATAGIPEKTQALTDITNEYNTKALEYRRMEEAVMKEGTLTDVQKSARLREISRVKNTELADIGIKQAVAQNNLSTAQQLVDRKIDLEYGDLKDIIGFQQSFLEMNREDLSKAEQNALNLRITENTRKYEEGKSIGEFAKQVAANGADASTITRVSSAKTMAEAIQAAGSFAGERDTQIVDAGGQKILIDSRTGQTIRSFGGNPVDPTGLTPDQAADPFVLKMLKTQGGKPLTDTPLQQINKGLTVLGQLGALQTNIEKTKTGPILGAFKGANPWDTNAQTIKAQLNAVVPNLARGIYGEVGVLTDNDIKTYSSTIGNLKSTNDVNNAIMYITLDLVGKSIKNTLEVQAAGGRDVSKFVDIYTEMQNTKNSILQSLPQPEQKQSQYLIQVGDKQLDLGSFEK